VGIAAFDEVEVVEVLDELPGINRKKKKNRNHK